MPNHDPMSRRRFLLQSLAAASACALSRTGQGQDAAPFGLDYILASCMYGELPLAEVVPAAPATGASFLDLWPRKHGNQREQLDAMGDDAFLDLLQQHGVALGMITRYDLGPFGLQEEMAVLSRLGGRILVSGSGKAAGADLKADVAAFLERMKPHAARAEELGVHIAIENHANSLLDLPDAIRYFAELNASPHLGVALAPYHLPQDTRLLADLIRALGPQLKHFYAWEHGHGCHDPLPKALEMQQLPGYGPLDFRPILAALREINYAGWTSVFMHPVPRGIPILPTARETTEAINRSREYLEYCLIDEA